MPTAIFFLAQKSVGPFPTNAPFISPNFTVLAGTTSISVEFNISSTDLADPTKNFKIDIKKTADNGEIAGFTWQGGGVGKDGVTFTQPSILFSVGGLDGQQINAVISMSLAMTLGLTVSTLP